ncbi:hypothetical protein ABZ443_18115, partial [Streptomyces shenzhenensis]
MATRPARLVLCLSPLLLVGIWGLTNRPLLYEGVARLAAADPVWLLAGIGFTCLGWVAASCVRQASSRTVPQTVAALASTTRRSG